LKRGPQQKSAQPQARPEIRPPARGQHDEV
jgi:hypothetical protein